MGESLLLSSLSSILPSPDTGEDVEFVHLEDKYICPIPKDARSVPHVLRNACQLPCGHHICEGCIDELFGDQPSASCPIKDEDCLEPFSKKEIFKDMCTRREVLMLEVYCPYKKFGCSQKLRLKSLDTHKKDCEYQPIPCSNEGCMESIPIIKMKMHKEAECQYRPTPCPYCQETRPYCMLNKHLKETCLSVPISCPNNCGVPQMSRTKINEHLKNCPMAIRNCAYSTIGCPFTGLDREVQEHEKMATDEHLHLMVTFSTKTNDQNLMLCQEMKNIKEENVELKKVIQQLHKENTKVKEEVDNFSKNVAREMKKRVANLMERQINMEQSLQDMPRKEKIEQQERDLIAVKEELAKNQERVNNLERLGPVGGIGNDLEAIKGNLMSQLKRIERQVAVQDVRLAELDLQFQVLETATYDGTLMWKIRDYSRRKQEAVGGRTLSLYSQPFYSSRFGYKMCARVYLNGDGMGKGTHLSLFFVVMRGEYDALLPWPFQRKVTLMLLDQETQTKHVYDTFQPDVASSSFMRPTSDMNIATGCPLFVKHTTLESKTYLKDNTIFLKVKIDTTGLPVH